jgi:hypothetical protein
VLRVESARVRVVFDELAGQYLYRDVVADMNTTRAIDNAHAALAQTRYEFIFPSILWPMRRIGIGQSNSGRAELK